MNKLFKILPPFSIIIFSLCIVNCNAQVNLVPNYSFEERTGCPDLLDQVYKTVGWNGYYSPDYLHKCSSDPYVSVPNNYFGHQNPHNSQDSAYCALETYYIDDVNGCIDSEREFLYTTLNSPLYIGTTYYVSFKVSAAFPGVWDDMRCFTDKIGVRFSMNNSAPPIDNFAHIYATTIINDTVNWTTVSGSFVADAAYEYIFIGNFFDCDNLNVSCLSTTWDYSFGYLYVDEICVSSDNGTCELVNSIKDENPQSYISIYPNPAKDKLNILVPFKSKNATIKIYNSMGALVIDEKINSNTIDVGQLENGVYVLNLYHNNEIYSSKFLISK